ncbi:hypothetical protein D3C71_1266830 [compost metagenome]
MRHDQPVLGLSHVQKAGGRAVGRVARVVQPLVHLVCQDPGARVTAMRQDGGLLLARQRPARGVVGCVDDQQARARCDGGQQRIHVKLPRAVHVGHQWHGAHLRTQNARLRHQVGPHGGDQHHLVARVHQRLHGHHQAVHTAGRHCDAVKPRIGVLLRVQAVHVARNCVAQFGQAQVVGIKGLALLQRRNGRVADEIGRHLVALAKPELQHIAAPQAFVGHFADARLFEALDYFSHAISLKYTAIIAGV